MIRAFDRDTGDMATSGTQFYTGEESTAMGAYHRLRMFLGEYFLDTSDGTDWFGSILGKASQDVAEVEIKQRILSAPDVYGIESFEFTTDRATRTIMVKCTIIDVNSELVELAINEVI